MSFLPGMFPSVGAGGEAAFPVVEGTNVGGTSGFSFTATFAAPLPSGIQSGELLIVFCHFGNGTLTTPSGWNLLFTATAGTGRFSGFYRVATGSEGSTVSITGSASSSWAINSYRISGYQGSPECGTAATGTGFSPDPPSLSPSWGAKKTLWIAAMGRQTGSGTTSTVPANYTDPLNYAHSVIAVVSAQCSSGRRELEASSENPAAFSSGSGGTPEWVAQTVAVQPA